jgi:sphingomyelin phosphodiesterase 3
MKTLGAYGLGRTTCGPEVCVKPSAVSLKYHGSYHAGTEMRQLLVHDALVVTPHGLSHAMTDDILMQTYILDSDITVSTPAIAQYLAKRDERGRVIPSSSGGRRRIDFVMPRKGTKAVSH